MLQHELVLVVIYEVFDGAGVRRDAGGFTLGSAGGCYAVVAAYSFFSRRYLRS